MAILPETPGRIAALTDGLDRRGDCARPPDPRQLVGERSSLRISGRVTTSSAAASCAFSAEDRPTWKAMNPRAWMKKTDYPDWEFAPAFTAFKEQRAELLDSPRAGWRQTPGSGRRR